MSEIMTILIYFNLSNYKSFKYFYLEKICKDDAYYFYDIVIYNRFIELIPKVSVALSVYIRNFRMSKETGILFIDSTKISVCNNRRIPSNKVFTGIVERGKGFMGWFYGFKVYLIFSDKGDIVSFSISIDTNFFVSLISGIIAYTFLPKHTSIRLSEKDMQILNLSYSIAV